MKCSPGFQDSLWYSISFAEPVSYLYFIIRLAKVVTMEKVLMLIGLLIYSRFTITKEMLALVVTAGLPILAWHEADKRGNVGSSTYLYSTRHMPFEPAAAQDVLCLQQLNLNMIYWTGFSFNRLVPEGFMNGTSACLDSAKDAWLISEMRISWRRWSEFLIQTDPNWSKLIHPETVTWLPHRLLIGSTDRTSPDRIYRLVQQPPAYIRLFFNIFFSLQTFPSQKP